MKAAVQKWKQWDDVESHVGDRLTHFKLQRNMHSHPRAVSCSLKGLVLGAAGILRALVPKHIRGQILVLGIVNI